MMFHNLFLLFVFFITSFGDLVQAIENQGFLSIDCGVEDDYLDHPTGIWFNSDKEFIGTGENHEIMPEYYQSDDVEYEEQFGKRYKTLRSFPNGTKNCYSLQLEEAKNKSFRIRASFAYGNYDRKNQPPKFDLYVGVNYWETVESNFTGVFYEIMYVFPTDTEYVCLVNTGSGFPFISSLEIRPSNFSNYGNGSSLEYLGIYDVNSGVGPDYGVRYSDDIYDRVWYPYRLPNSVPVSTTSDIDIQDGSNLYKVPAEVLRTAVQPPNGSNSMTGSFSFLSNYKYNVYFHFAELEDVEDEPREITITVNGISQGPFTLEYLKPLSISFQNLQIEGEITFTIATRKESGLPPILNAFEIYQLTQFKLSATNLSDVDAIMSTKHAFNIDRDDWQGDPCLPKDTTWTGLSCRYDNTPRIISLNLSSSKLTGEISPSLALLQEIESIDLSYNELTGSVPDVLARLPKLKVLNLSGNKLKGPIPQSLQDKSDNGSLLLSFIEDQNSCQRDHCEGNSKKFIVPLVISIVVAVALVTLLSVIIIFHRKKWRKRTEVVNSTASNKEELLKSKNRPFTYFEIATITANFNTEIGDGGFGKVFLGHLNDGTPVAVKLLSSSSKQGYKEFQAEAQSLMIVHHKNLVSLIGYCKEYDHMALVYEFMANGNLKQHLSETKEHVLNWNQRLQIAVDAAQGLDYLHNGCKPPIIHRDLKPSNILLTEKMQAKIADFGLSRFVSTENASHILTSCPAGTLGYFDPEFHALGNLNKKIDVYSFGIILFELITGQPVIIRSSESSIHITEWVRPMIEKGDIRMIVDPRLENEFDVNAAWKAVEIALSCALQASKHRPDMSHVLAELKECLGRNEQRVLTETTSLVMDPDMLPVAR